MENKSFYMKGALAGLVVLLATTISFGQIKSKLPSTQTPLKISTIENIMIRKVDGITDSSKYAYRQLTDTKHFFNFIRTFNEAKSVGPTKYIVLYWIDVWMLDGSKRTFRTNANYVKENNDHTFDLGDKTYIENIWQTATPVSNR